eukprot:5590993-Amphidinium_carterae.1
MQSLWQCQETGGNAIAPVIDFLILFLNCVCKQLAPLKTQSKWYVQATGSFRVLAVLSGRCGCFSSDRLCFWCVGVEELVLGVLDRILREAP